MPTDLSQTFIAKPEEPASTVPSGVMSGITLDPAGIAKGVLEAAPPAPTQDEVRAAHQKADDARTQAMKRQTSFDERMAPQIAEYETAARAYGQKAQENVPKPGAIPPPPSRGLSMFLSPTTDEPPEATISKFLQAMSLFATMAGGGKMGARSSLSAFTGMLEGWREGNRDKADRSYKTWRDSTEVMLRQFDDEMRSYNSLMIAERVPLEQRLRAMELQAYQHKNSMLAEELRIAEADKATTALQKRIDARQGLEKWYAEIVGKKEDSDRRYELKLKELEAATEKHNNLLDYKMKALDQALQVGMAKAEAMQAKAAATTEAKVPVGQLDTMQSLSDNLGYLKEMDRLVSGGTVDLNKIVGGIRPWVNQLIQRWGQKDSPLPPPGTTAGEIPRTGGLNADENRFLAILQNFGDSILRQRSGAAIGVAEMGRMLTFVPDQSVSAATVRARLALSRDIAVGMAETWTRKMALGGYRSPQIEASDFSPRGAKPADAANPYNLKKEGNEWVSPDGKHVWRGGAWQKR